MRWGHGTGLEVCSSDLSGRTVVVCLPDQRDVDALHEVMSSSGLEHVVLTAEQGRAARYRRFLLALTGQTREIGRASCRERAGREGSVGRGTLKTMQPET